MNIATGEAAGLALLREHRRLMLNPADGWWYSARGPDGGAICITTYTVDWLCASGLAAKQSAPPELEAKGIKTIVVPTAAGARFELPPVKPRP